MATLTDTDTTEARGLPHPKLKPKLPLLPNPKPMLMPKLPLMPGTDTTVWDTVDTMDMVWDTTDTDTVWDTVDTTDTDIPVLTDTTDITSARGLLMPNLKPMLMPKLIPPLMLGTDTDTDTTVENCFFNVISCHFLNNPPLELSKPTLLPSAILLKTVFFYKKNCYKTDIWTHCNQK